MGVVYCLPVPCKKSEITWLFRGVREGNTLWPKMTQGNVALVLFHIFEYVKGTTNKLI